MNDWMFCDGQGGLSRRGFLAGAGVALGTLTGLSSALAQVQLRPDRREGNVVVILFLRGGADGLSFFVPYREDGYHRVRPSVGLAAPTNQSAAANLRTLDLDGFFGLNPALAALLPLYREGQLAGVHAVGSNDGTHSHFEAMSAMERGLAEEGPGPSDGWLARHLNATAQATDTPLRAVSLGTTMPDSLRGAKNAIAMERLDEFRIDVSDARKAKVLAHLERMGQSGHDQASISARETVRTLRALDLARTGHVTPATGYPDSDLGRALRDVAALSRAKVGLEVACVDKGGWDSHVTQGAGEGWVPNLLKDLGDCLAAFYKDLGPESSRVTTVVMTEFGRRVQENSGLGTDHGHGSMMMVLGGGVRGNKIYGRWPGLEPAQLSGPGDLAVTTDYRTVLSEVVSKRLGNPKLTDVFPEAHGTPLGILA